MDLQQFLSLWRSSSPTLTVSTSGSTGQPKQIVVEKERMRASARQTCRFLGLQPGDTALLCMPLDYIAGQMMVVRSEECGLRLLAVEPSSHPLASIGDEPIHFAAMTPMQVSCSLQQSAEAARLRRIGQLIIGGGAVDDELAQQLSTFPNGVWSTYGMTETLSHVALRRLSGPERSQWYTPLPGVSVSQAADGCLVVSAPAVCSAPQHTHDICQLRDGRFRIVGRSDNVVCSGGIKIQIEEAERQLRPHLSQPFLLTYVPHRQLGQQLVMLCQGAVSAADVVALSRRCLPRYWHVQQVFSVERLPLTATGKPARAEAAALAQRMAAVSEAR